MGVLAFTKYRKNILGRKGVSASSYISKTKVVSTDYKFVSISRRSNKKDYKFVSISHRSQFVSISDWLFNTYKLKYINFKFFESILGIVTILTNEKYLYFALLKTFINWYVMHSLFLLMMNVSHGSLKILLIISSTKPHVTIIFGYYT